MIKSIQYDTLLKSSFLMWFEHNLLTGLQAFENHSSDLYDIKDQYSNHFTFAAPYKGIISDDSVPNATVMSGVYIGGTFSAKGANNLVDIDFDESQVIFSAEPGAVISGDYAVKDYNVKLTDRSQENVIFESRFELKPSTTNNIANTGLQPNTETFPVIYLMVQSSKNEEAAFGGQELTMTRIRAISFSDSLFAADSIDSMFRDKVRVCFPIFDEAEMPFNAWGGLITSYNYTGMSATKGAGDMAFIDNVRVSRIDSSNISSENTDIFVSVIDFDVEKYRFPRGSS